MSRTLRRSAFGTSLLLALVAWTLLFAWPGAGAPWKPTARLELPLASFESRTVELGIDEHGLRARAGEPGKLVDLHLGLDDLVADDYRHFSYLVDGLPATRKLVLVWEGSEGRGFAILPDGAGRGGTLDLGRVATWKGRLSRIGLALVPVDYVPPEALSAPELRIDRLQLASTSIGGALVALCTEWTAARPWTGRSPNTGGFDFVGSSGPSLPAYAAGLATITLLLAGVWFGRSAARRAAVPLIVGAGALLLVEQLWQHQSRTATVIAAHRALPPGGDIALSGHPPLAADARALLERLRDENGRVRLRVHGVPGFASEYAGWLLREQDVGAVLAPHELPSGVALRGSFLVLVGAGDWDFDASVSKLRIGAETRTATLYFEGATMKAYRFGARGASP